MLCTHGGVITGLLSAYGLPRAQPYEWMCEPGCGYSVRITPSLWMRSMVMEVFQTLPLGEEGERPGPSGGGHRPGGGGPRLGGKGDHREAPKGLTKAP